MPASLRNPLLAVAVALGAVVIPAGAASAVPTTVPTAHVLTAVDPAGPGVLASGASLGPGQELVSAAGYRLVMQPDGNAVTYRSDGRPLWDSRTSGYPDSTLTMQPDGNLVVRSAQGAALWSSQTSGEVGSAAVIQDDGNLVIYRGDRAVWDSNSHRPLYEWQYTLYPGEVMTATQTRDLYAYRLVMQADGSIALYGIANTIWSSATVGYPGAELRMQPDGNLVLYTAAGDYPSRAVWQTGTAGQGQSRLVIDDATASLSLIRADGTTTWSTLRDTSIRIAPAGAVAVTGAVPDAACGPRGTRGATGSDAAVVCAPTDSDPNGAWRPPTQAGAFTLAPGETLQVDEQLFAYPYRLMMQGDGNLVLFLEATPVWSTQTSGEFGATATFQPDGNLVVYTGGTFAGRPLWQSATAGSGGSTLRMQADGNLVIYRADATPVWSRIG